MSGQEREALTAEGFELEWAGGDREAVMLHRQILKCVPCECDSDDCLGFAMVPRAWPNWRGFEWEKEA